MTLSGGHERVTVVTITKDDPAGLVRTRRSVVAQSERCEHLIIDGGSGSQVALLLGQMAEDGAKVWSGADGGRYHAMNRGIEMSSCPLLVFLHSGDMFASDSVLARVLESYDAVCWQWAYGLTRILNKDGSVRGVGGDVPFRLPKFALAGKIIPHQAAFFDRELIDRVGGYSTTFGIAADQEFMMRCAMASLPYVIADFLCDFDGSGAGSTRSLASHLRDMARARHQNRLKVYKPPFLDDLVSAVLAAGTLGRAFLSSWQPTAYR